MCTMYITRHWLVLLRDQKVAHLRDRYTCNVIGKHCFMEYWPTDLSYLGQTLVT